MCTGLPPGFQFVPSDEDLVVHFLHRKASFLPGQHDLVPTLALCDPWELHGRALLGGNNHWYFFARSTENKVTASGYWGEEEEEEEGVSNGDEEVVGVKKTFVFRVGKDPEGTKTGWVMHEYHLLESTASSSSCSSSRRTSRMLSRKNGQRIMESETWVICRVHDDDRDNAREGYFDDDGTELSFMDEEAFLSLDDDLDEASWPL